LLSGLIRGLDLPQSLCWAVAAGSLKVKNVGAATTLPDYFQIEALANTLQVQAEA
jgi:sugar/nucleoside kinase (ribokinase family)